MEVNQEDTTLECVRYYLYFGPDNSNKDRKVKSNIAYIKSRDNRLYDQIITLHEKNLRLRQIQFWGEKLEVQL